MAIEAPLIHEQLIRLPHASPGPADFKTPLLKKMVWDYRYLHALEDNGQHLFYVCGIQRPTLFAYQLLAHTSNLHLASMTSSYMALLQAYRAIFGPSFRSSQLALDMIKHHYQLQNVLSADSIARLLHLSKPLNLAEHKGSLLTMIGLHYSEREKI
jgi:hypothetical protein